MIDVHCHLEDEAFEGDVDEVVERAKRAGVKAIIISPIHPDDVDRAFMLKKLFSNYIYVTIGLDPTILDEEVFDKQRKRIMELRNEIVGIGEVGLDYYYVRNRDARRVQEDYFRKWISLARSLRLPLVVHSRSAGKYAIEIVVEEGYDRVLLHAFDGSSGWALKGASYGMYFSIPPSVWFSRQKQNIVKVLPLESLMLESDSPVLSPIRNTRNEPANILYSARKISEIKRVSFEKVIEVTSTNAMEFFGIKL